MKKLLLIFVSIIITFNYYGQKIKTNYNVLIIPHDDITLYLTKDTCTMVSVHTLKYSNFIKLDKERDDIWFKDIYNKKYSKKSYNKSGYDIGHLTPSHITSYNNTINHYSFSLFNAAPQKPFFNRGNWKKLEKNVEDSISKYKKNCIIITGVIYDTNTKMLNNSKIPIPSYYYKVLNINNKFYCWLGNNNDGNVIEISLTNLNIILNKNMCMIIN